jgi:cytochrome c peroxidase
MNLSQENPLTHHGIALGRVLFFDPMLDRDNGRTCAGCHIANESFSSQQENSLPLINLVWNYAYLWNGKVDGTLEDVMEFEVKRFFRTDLVKFNKNKDYRKRFQEVFGVHEITSREIAFALAQYVRTFISANSKYDRFLRGEVKLTTEEENGRRLYFTERGDCFHCHGTVLLTDNDFHNNGLDSLPFPGRSEVTGNRNDRGKFKTPTLRNIAMTAPYMHDGRFKTLEEVIDFYSDRVSWSPTIDPLMKKVKTHGIQLNPREKKELLAFLKTFTDSSFINNPAFSTPFLSFSKE